MLPREHGAYSQMVLPIVTALAVSGATVAAVLLAMAVLCGFLAHEPLIVLLGCRGTRARDAYATRAAVSLTIAGLVMIAAGLLGISLTPPAVRWFIVLPVVPALVVAGALIAKRDRTAVSQIAAALAFSFAAVPMALAAGATMTTALSLGITFALIFVAGTLSVRVLVLRVRAGGRPRAVRATRLALLVTTGAAGAAIAVATAHAALPWTTLLAAGPGLTAAIMLALRASAPKLRTVGWTLTSTSVAAAVILIGS